MNITFKIILIVLNVVIALQCVSVALNRIKYWNSAGPDVNQGSNLDLVFVVGLVMLPAFVFTYITYKKVKIKK